MMYLCTEMQYAKLLLSIHLNDNGITEDVEYMYEILDSFGIYPKDIPQIKKQEESPNKNNNVFNEIDDDCKKNLNLIDSKLQNYMRQKSPEHKHSNSNQKKNGTNNGEINNLRNEYKEYILLSKQLDNYQKQKQINICKHFSGLGRTNIGLFDFFTLTRVLNHPELIFNQRPNQDYDKNNRYFQIDSATFWELSVKSECFVCQKHMYVQIHYQRGILAQNQDLIEIKDQQILDQLKYQYNKEYLSHRNTTPLIYGTIVNKNRNQNTFERCLKMLRTPLYCLLTVCQCKQFSETKQQVFRIKDGVKKFLKTDAYELLEEMKVVKQLLGWQFILHDMVMNNEVYDVCAINLPELQAYNIEKQEWFTFAGFMQPGYHQFLIYDPKLERAFCKDFVTKLNQRDFVYPEYPLAYNDGPAMATPNMWKHWIEDDDNSLQKSYNIDIQSEKFRIDRFIKNKEDAEKTVAFLKEKYSEIMTYQKTLIVGSTQAPQINFENISQSINSLQEKAEYPAYNPSGKLSRAQVELCFIGATLSDGMAGLKGALQRAELLDFLMRLCQQFTKQVYSSKANVSDHLQEFWDIYVIPLIIKNDIIEHRKIIRQSKKLNQLLFDNNKGLIEIFEQAKYLDDNGKNGFTLKAAIAFFTNINKPGELYLSRRQIETIFMYSMMSVIDEFKHEKKYSYLLFVEFQEMICRASIVGFDGQMIDTIEFMVYNFLDYLWEYQYAKGYWKPEQKELVKVNQELIF